MTQQLTGTLAATLAANPFLCDPQLLCDTKPMTDCDEVGNEHDERR
jgi:hypothetical protein